MSLRQRLLAALVGSGLVTVAILTLARELIVARAAQSELRRALEAHVDALDDARCEQEGFGGGPPPPGRFGPHEGEHGRGRPDGPPLHGPQREYGPSGPGSERGPGPGGPRGRRPIEVSFFAHDFTPRRDHGPPFPDAARAALAGGATFAAVKVHEYGPEMLAGVLATGWASPRCAYAVAVMPMPPSLLSRGALGLTSLAFLAALAGALFVAFASPVRRIRALAEGMRVAAARRYEHGVGVEGRDEIAGLAQAFNDAAGTARAQLLAVESRERALREFVAHTTHDVGIPLTVLAGALTEIRERAAGGRPLEAALADATRETQYVASLLHNLGAVTRLETEEALRERHPVDLTALVERVILRHAAPARDAGVELNHAVPEAAVTLQGDVTLLEQAVNNLVHNAIRYNRRGGHVGVVLDAAAERFELKVSDDGPGVSEEERQRLGEPWFRGGEARTRRPEGTGLGLSIARAVAERHGLQLGFRRSDAGGLEALLSGRTGAAEH